MTLERAFNFMIFFALSAVVVLIGYNAVAIPPIALVGLLSIIVFIASSSQVDEQVLARCRAGLNSLRESQGEATNKTERCVRRDVYEL